MATETPILAKVLEISDEIRKDPAGSGGTKAELLRKQAIDAIKGGMGSTAWSDYMTNFASSQRQLDRLCGNDPTFTHQYKDECLAYMVANITCGVDTHRNGDRGTLNFVQTDVIAALDRW